MAEDGRRDRGPDPGDGDPGESRERLAEELRRARADCAEMLEGNRKLRELLQRKDDLLALCAHDLRTPIDLLLGQARLLLSGARGELTPDQRRSLEALERQGRRVREVAEDLAGLRTLEAGRTGLDLDLTDLARLCNEVADVFAPAVRDRGGALVRSLPPYPLAVPIDPGKVRRVLTTLFSEAILSTAPGGRLEVSLEPLPRGARVTLDFQPPNPVEPRVSPSGMGLAVCRELVELHGGVLDATAGRFSVTLPSAPRGLPALASIGARRAGALGQAGRPRILVVEDEPDAREALALVLEPAFEVATARDGEEGVRVARSEPPEIILMDLVMPGMDGFAALEALRNDPHTAEIPVILISGRGDDVTKARGLDLGAVDYLQKPFSEKELLARIERTLRLTQRQVQLREMAQTDTLTGLANLRAFRARLEEEVKRARRYRTPLTCVMADMDRLKPVNDEMGHAAGDRAIAAVAEVIRGELRETDFGARYGGDEFVVLLPHTGAEEGRVFAERVCQKLKEQALEVAGRRVVLAASFGVAELAGGAAEEGGEIMVRQADEALYAAKRAGRAQVAVHDGSATGARDAG